MVFRSSLTLSSPSASWRSLLDAPRRHIDEIEGKRDLYDKVSDKARAVRTGTLTAKILTTYSIGNAKLDFHESKFVVPCRFKFKMAIVRMPWMVY